MKVLATQKAEIEIDEQEQRRICLEYLNKRLDWSDNYFIENDWVCENVDAHTTHSFEYVKKIRKVNQGDKCLAFIKKCL